MLLTSAVRFAAPDGATIDLPGAPSRHGPSSDGFEAFSRVALLQAIAAPWRESSDSRDELFVRGIVAGVEPGGRGGRRWPEPGPKSHAIVDAGHLALAMLLRGPIWWQALPESSQSALADWLIDAAAAHTPENNWVVFRIVIASLLRVHGVDAPAVARAVDDSLELLESWYDSDSGWYSDGAHGTYDYYNSFALHTLPALAAWLEGDAVLAARFTPRLRRFARSSAALFDLRGRPIAFGRSLSYRFGTLAAISADVALHGGEEPALSAEVMGECISGFLADGACNADGVLTRGWRRGLSAPVENYLGPGAPYLASLAYLPLLVPQASPFWVTRDGHAPATGGRIGGSTGLVVDTQHRRSLSVMLNHGSNERVGTLIRKRLEHPAYDRLAYSSQTTPHAHGMARERGVTLLVDGETWTRGVIRPVAAGENWASSWSNPRRPSGEQAVGEPEAERGRDHRSCALHIITLFDAGWQVDVVRVLGAPKDLSEIWLGGWALRRQRRSLRARTKPLVRGDGFVSAIRPLSPRGATQALEVRDTVETSAQALVLPAVRFTELRRADRSLTVAVASLLAPGQWSTRSPLRSSPDVTTSSWTDAQAELQVRWGGGRVQSVNFRNGFFAEWR